MKRDGTNPTILYGYGGFEVSLTPRYSPAPWQALARARRRLRPGQHPRRRRVRSRVARGRAQDATASASTTTSPRSREDLIARKITSPRRLGIMGGSNGGLLMGVAVDAASRAVERGRHPGAAARHAALRADRRPALVGGRVRLRPDARGARVPREDLAVQEPQAGVDVSEAVDLDDDQGRPRRSAACAQVRGEDGGHGVPYLFYEVIEGGMDRARTSQQRAHTDALEFTYFARQLMDASKPTP